MSSYAPQFEIQATALGSLTGIWPNTGCSSPVERIVSAAAGTLPAMLALSVKAGCFSPYPLETHPSIGAVSP